MNPVNRLWQYVKQNENQKRIGAVKKSFKGVSWFAVGVVFIFVLGVVFFIIGVCELSTHHDSEEDPSSATSGWIFFAIGMILMIMGISAFIGKCFCPRPAPPQQRQVRTQHRHRGRRVSSLNDRPGPRNTQRIYSLPSPTESVVPIGDVIPPSSSSRNLGAAERRPSWAPPTYDEATGRIRQSVGILINHLEPDPPPYNPSEVNSAVP